LGQRDRHSRRPRMRHDNRVLTNLQDFWRITLANRAAENGDVVAATLDDEATVKRFKRENGHVWLLPHNSPPEPVVRAG
ncbi:S24 family peptidase, partial [Streptomyces collinus]|uniref:S24 family peptidase n=1 Tax=Streptomyces collinus TaxID=42684 RepID=UPI0033D0A2C4